MKATFKVHRVNRGLSIEDAAEKIGIDVDRLRKIEAYELEVTPQEIKAICELYEIEFLNEIIFYNKEQKLNYIKTGSKKTDVYPNEIPKGYYL